MVGSVRRLTGHIRGAGGPRRPPQGVAMFKKIPIFAMFLCLLALMTAAQGQAGKGVIVGQVRDAAGSTLHGAKIDLQPRVQPVTSDSQAAFSLSAVSPGAYTITIPYLGFTPYTGSLT